MESRRARIDELTSTRCCRVRLRLVASSRRTLTACLTLRGMTSHLGALMTTVRSTIRPTAEIINIFVACA